MSQDANFDIEQVQGNILRGYRRKLVRHLVLGIRERRSAADFLARAAKGGDGAVPAVTREAPWVPKDQRPPKPDAWFNIGLTYEGARALGLPADTLASFPTEFVEGMAKRAIKIGDVGESAPGTWDKPFDRPERIHLLASIYADDKAHLDRVEKQVTLAFDLLEGGRRDGYSHPDDRVLFGYIDNISQPRFPKVVDPDQHGVDEPLDPFGTALLGRGRQTRVEGLTFRAPSPDAFGDLGTFNAFRVLAQDCQGFEDTLTAAAAWLLEHARSGDLLSAEAEAKIVRAYADAAAKAKQGGTGQAWATDAPLDRLGALRELLEAALCLAGAQLRRHGLLLRVEQILQHGIRHVPLDPTEEVVRSGDYRGRLTGFLDGPGERADHVDAAHVRKVGCRRAGGHRRRRGRRDGGGKRKQQRRGGQGPPGAPAAAVR